MEFGLATAIAYARAGVSIILLTGRHSDTLQVAKRQVLEAANEAGKVKDVHVEVYSTTCAPKMTSGTWLPLSKLRSPS